MSVLGALPCHKVPGHQLLAPGLGLSEELHAGRGGHLQADHGLVVLDLWAEREEPPSGARERERGGRQRGTRDSC